MKKLIGVSMVVSMCGLLGVVKAEGATITIDGAFVDWSGIPNAATDPAGDSAPFAGLITDILTVQLVAEDGTLFTRLSYAGAPFLGVLLFDIDNNPLTGATAH